MEEMINIAKILKGKPKGIRLFSPIFGECAFSLVREETDDICVKKHNGVKEFFDSKGLYNTLGECLLFPSREMRDWSKFAWKKGDVLVYKDGTVHIIFEGFEDDTYRIFKGKYYLWEDNGHIEQLDDRQHNMETSSFIKANDDDTQTYINTIEKRLCGKFNRETLGVEKIQPEFKDGDIVCISGMGYLAYGIVKSIDNSSKKLEYYVLNDMSTLKTDDWLSFEDKQIQPITETQQIILFDVLAKEGKAWDADKKQIVDLKSLWTPKPFDNVLVRHQKTEEWRANIFSHTDKTDEYLDYVCVNGRWEFCIPYEGNESLLGTTKDVED